MALEGCYTCIKYLMFAFNFLFWLLGCAVLGIGIWIKVDPITFHEYSSNENFASFLDELNTVSYLSIGAYVLIAVGSVIMLIGFLGCCGAIRESQCMLISFFVLLFVIFSVLVACGVFIIMKKEHLHDELSKKLKETIEKVKNDDAAAIDMMTYIQTKFHCCGAGMGLADYGTGITDSKCEASNYLKPCTPKIYDLLSQNFVIIAGVAVGIAAVLFLGMIFSLLLCCAIREAAEGGSKY